MKASRLFTSLLLAALFVAPMAGGESPVKPTLDVIGNEVQCTCGCVAPLNQCPMLNCSEKSETRAFIAKEIADSKGETAILQDLSLRYGVQILSAPPAHGFNLAVWILPGLALLVGLGFVILIVRRWKRQPEPSPMPAKDPRDPKVQNAVEEEMKSMKLG